MRKEQPVDLMGSGLNGRLVTIILPVFNEAAVLEDSMRSIQSYLERWQAGCEFEILIVNDGSSDGSGAIAERLAQRNTQIRVLHHPRNFGVGQALRHGFSQSRGDYVVVLDVDLSYEPEHIGLLLERMSETRAKLVLASPYMEGGQLTNVPRIRRFFSVWGNRFLRIFARGGVSTLTCMVRAYDGPFVRSLVLKSQGMDLMPEAIYKTMTLGGRIEEVPAHLDWSRQVVAGVRRASSMRILAHILSTVFSGFFFRPFMFFILPGLAILAFAAYVNVWMFIHFFDAYWAMPSAVRDSTVAFAAAYAAHPHTFIVALLSLMLAMQFLGLGILAVQMQKYFEELFFMGTVVRRAQGTLVSSSQESRSLER